MLSGATIEWLNQLWFAGVLRDSPWLLPTIESLHLLGYCVIFGMMLTANLQVFGFGVCKENASGIARQMRPWGLAGLAISVATGSLLFLYEPGRFSANNLFPWKLGFVAMAAAFEFSVRPRMSARRANPKVLAGVSLALWMGAALGGLAVSLDVQA